MPEPVLPHNIDAEQAVIGAVLLDNEVYERIAEIVKDSDFYEPLHKSIYEQSVELIRKGQVQVYDLALCQQEDAWAAVDAAARIYSGVKVPFCQR